MTVRDEFWPSVNGLHYRNDFSACGRLKLVLPVLGLRGGLARNGLCGGMIFYARDLFEAGWLPPPDTSPPCGGEQFACLSRRLFDSFNLPLGPLRYLHRMNPRKGRAAADEWPRVRAELDQGRLPPLGLILELSRDPRRLGRQHQVLACGWRLEGGALAVRVYDPNHADHDRVTLSLDAASLDDPARPAGARLSCADCGTSVPVHAFFLTRYTFRNPPIHGPAFRAPQ